MSFFGIKTKKERREELEWLEQQAVNERILAEKAEKEKLQREQAEQERKQKEFNELIEKYKSNSRVKRAAEDFANKYIDEMKDLIRMVESENEENFSHEYGLGWRSRTTIDKIEYIEHCFSNDDYVTFNFDQERRFFGPKLSDSYFNVPPLIDFREENLQAIDIQNAKALVYAISALAYNFIIDKKNQCNITFTLETKEFNATDYFDANGRLDGFSSIVECPGYGVMFYCKGKNENYQAPEPPKEWF